MTWRWLDKETQEERDAFITELKAQGLTKNQIATRTRLSFSRVGQILRRERRKSAGYNEET